jgi:hypothetical protein
MSNKEQEAVVQELAHKTTEQLEKQLIAVQNAYTDEHEAWGMCQLDWERLNKENKELEAQAAAMNQIWQTFIKKMEELLSHNVTTAGHDLPEKLKVAEKVARKACKMIADTLGYCPYTFTREGNAELAEIAAALGCDVGEGCENKDAYCWFKYFRLDLDEKPIGGSQDES